MLGRALFVSWIPCAGTIRGEGLTSEWESEWGDIVDGDLVRGIPEEISYPQLFVLANARILLVSLLYLMEQSRADLHKSQVSYTGSQLRHTGTLRGKAHLSPSARYVQSTIADQRLKGYRHVYHLFFWVIPYTSVCKGGSRPVMRRQDDETVSLPLDIRLLSRGSLHEQHGLGSFGFLLLDVVFVLAPQLLDASR